MPNANSFTQQVSETGTQVTPSVLVDANGRAVSSEALSGTVALSSPPAQTSAGADTSLTFTQQVNHLMIQNNCGADLHWELDATSSLGSPLLSTGQTIFLDIECTVLHIFTAAAQNVNGSSSGNIVVRGWL